MFCEYVTQRIGGAEKAPTPAENMRSTETGPFFLSPPPPPLPFQTLFDSFSSVNKIKNIIGKMPSGLLKAVLMHQLEFRVPKKCELKDFFYR